MAPIVKMTRLDKAILAVAPGYGVNRLRARAMAGLMERHYEAAAVGRRTSGWSRRHTDANAAATGALALLRSDARDLVRNNAWAKNALRVIVRNVVGYGITPKPVGGGNAKLAAAWKAWAETTACDAEGLRTFAGLEKLVARTVAESGEVLIRRRWRRPDDGLPIPLQFQVLEPDHIDTNRSGKGQQGGEIVHGIEFDAIGRRVAYWLFDRHPGSSIFPAKDSKRYLASEIIHVFDPERAGQDRGVTWFAPVIVSLKDFDEFEDATLMKQKIAAFFAVFKTDIDGAGSPLGATSPSAPGIEAVEPGSIVDLAPGQDVKFSNPPSAMDDGFSARTLRRIAAGLGITYEDLTGDYSGFNFSSSRASRISHWLNVWDWQWNMLIPQFCDPAWAWAMEAASTVGLVSPANLPGAEWTPMPMPLTDPDREARANVLMVRSGQKTLSQVIREQGNDPETHLAELAADMKRLDALGLHLDVDVRRVSQAGLTQARPAGTGFNDEAKDAEELVAAKGGEAEEPPADDKDADTEIEQDAGE